jgi:hypothetical protein
VQRAGPRNERTLPGGVKRERECKEKGRIPGIGREKAFPSSFIKPSLALMDSMVLLDFSNLPGVPLSKPEGSFCGLPGKS